jgi:Mannosylglycerate hydrolase MGH1-like glycoside hydrolase domain
MNPEQDRIDKPLWKKWGPYVTDRQWGTVREDYSAHGAAWEFVTHDMARSKAYRWGEEGIAGICDEQQFLCFAIALWNKKDPILKERYFGLTGNQGNHGEDVKECYYYLDNTPTHSYMKMLYKYPQSTFPYQQLIDENKKRGKNDPEFELIDTEIFNQDYYTDIIVEYAKNDPEDILIKITIYNRSSIDARLNVLPTIWFRNTWDWGYDSYKPVLTISDQTSIRIHHQKYGDYFLYCDGSPELLFTDNESNNKKLYGVNGQSGYFKDGVNNYIVQGDPSVNPSLSGTKAAANYDMVVAGDHSAVITLRLIKTENKSPFVDFNSIFEQRKKEADLFYSKVQNGIESEDTRNVQRQAFAGLLWSKQFYYFNIHQWLNGDPAQPVPTAERKNGRNREWKHLNNASIISMPDKWEYPWFAAWDLCFHAVAFMTIDPDFSKNQLLLLTKEWYMHPNGQLPAYEWNFGDVNPPVQAWAAWRVYRGEQRFYETAGDRSFLEAMFHKLSLNFTWWVNRKDEAGNNLFEGGFLGLDNIGVFDRNQKLPPGISLAQSDGTSWMAMYSLNMMRIALELAKENPVYQDMATKFFEHFLYIAEAMFKNGVKEEGLWDSEDQFYYDMLYSDDGRSLSLKLRSMVGLIPMFAVEVLEDDIFLQQNDFVNRLNWFLDNRPDLASLVSRWNEKNPGEKHLLSLLRGERLTKILVRMLDESEFLSPFGIRSLSKCHEANAFAIFLQGQTLTARYTPAEGDSFMFGGNSNWRGPIWMPMNYLILESLRRFYQYYGDDFKVEYPTHSGNYMNLFTIFIELAKRMTRIFLRDEKGRRPVFGANEKMQTDPHFKDYILFYEYFHGDTGRGVGASHQTGWTALIGRLLFPMENEEKWKFRN